MSKVNEFLSRTGAEAPKFAPWVLCECEGLRACSCVELKWKSRPLGDKLPAANVKGGFITPPLVPFRVLATSRNAAVNKALQAEIDFLSLARVE